MNRAIIVEETLLADLQDNLNILIYDWKNEGAEEIFIITHPRGAHLNPQDMKDKLKALDNLEGALLIGDLPIAMLQKSSIENNYPFMSEVFFMDLTGEWDVGEKNVVTCANPSNPTIFVGRIAYAPDTGWQQAAMGEILTEIEYYNRYLAKLHNFRMLSRYLLVQGVPYPVRPTFSTINIRIPPYIRFGFRALMINNFGAPGSDYSVYLRIFSHLYPLENIEHHGYVTNTEMLTMVTENHYDCIWVQAHSTPGGHNMAGGTVWNSCNYMNEDIWINFFFFEACSSGRIVWYDQSDPSNPDILKLASDNTVSNILFSPHAGIVTIAQSISAGFTNALLFFDKLQLGGSFGQAFKEWLIEQYDFNNGDIYNYMNLFGDPFVSFGLLPEETICIIRTSFYGTSKEYKIIELRKWRNNFFTKKKLGRLLIKSLDKLNLRFIELSIKSKAFRILVREITSICLSLLKITPLKKKLIIS